MPVASLVERRGNPKMADEIRKIADQVESGEVRDWAIVTLDVTDQSCCRISSFDDRFRLLGAIEYLKGGLV